MSSKENAFWFKQAKDKPLFEELLWSRPEGKLHAGKLLIIGGNLYAFSSPANAYTESLKAGVGTTRVLLPDALKKTVGKHFEAGEFAPSNPSGGFNKQSLAEWLDMSNWADGVLFCGDLGHNSETAITLESFVNKYSGQMTLTKDTIDLIFEQPKLVFTRENTTLVITIQQLSKLCIKLGWETPVTFSIKLQQLVSTLRDLTIEYSCNLVVRHNDVIYVAVDGKVSTTPVEPSKIWRVKTASHMAVWWLQNPQKPFEALTTASVH